MTTALAERPDMRDHAWHIRSVPATHLTWAMNTPSVGSMPVQPGTLCGRRGGPVWVPGVNPGTVWWCNACGAAWNRRWRDEDGGA